jgi:hypothetical protein
MRPVRFGIHKRRGYHLMEIAGAIVVLGVAATLTTRLIVESTRVERSNSRRMIAINEASNVVERLATIDWDRLDADLAAAMKLDPDAAARLPQASLITTIDRSKDDLLIKKIHVEIAWMDSTGTRARPVTLTVWRARPGRNAR